MKILVGICGIGNGHLNRQTSVIKYLIQKNHQIVVATTDNNIEYFKKNFNKIDIINISIPWITCNCNGIDFKDSLKKYVDNKVDQYKSFFEFSINVEKIFLTKPDLVITDYEPNVAQYSYAVGIPLICMEQQSKFLFIEEEKIKNFSIVEEKRRLNYFFPKFEYKIISSFFPIEINDDRIKVVSPIISKLNKKTTKSNNVLVYFSPYDDSEKYDKILNILSKINNYNFIVYTKLNFPKYLSVKNIVFKKFNESFKSDLENAEFLIATSGHQLISEAISIDVPLYLIPLDTYEQNYNALMVEKYGLGICAKKITAEELLHFCSKVDKYSENIMSFKNKYHKKSWEESLEEILNKCCKE